MGGHDQGAAVGLRERGARARALACGVGGLLGLALVRSVTPPASTECAEPRAASIEEPARVACGGKASGGPGGLPLGVRRVLDLPIDLNALTEADFESLSGIGPKIARRVVEARVRRGGFRSVDDIGEVRGIGPARLAALRAALHGARP